MVERSAGVHSGRSAVELSAAMPAAFATGPPLVDQREDTAMAPQMAAYHAMARLLQPSYGQMPSQQAMLHGGAAQGCMK